MSKFIPQNFNDLLALGAIIIIPGIWIMQAVMKVAIPAEVNGALIVTWSLIFQYYFRKSKTEA